MDNQSGCAQVPFLKWAGGKRWLVERHTALLDLKFNRYIEPFLGSAAVFFKLAPERALLADRNSQLIETYQTIRDDWQRVQRHLRRHHNSHCNDYYYEMRAKKPTSPAGRAAQFVYLNRTCWNGLYRVNLNGEFNVPVGTKTNVILDTDDFRALATVLSKAEIRCCDFESTLSEAGANDFVFADPPYTVKHNHNGFIKYNEALFSWDDQVRLRDCIVEAVGRGAKVLVTNAYHDCVKDLYDGVGTFKKLSRASVISGDHKARGTYEELLIECGN